MASQEQEGILERVGKVLVEYKTIYPDPITMRAGDQIEVTDKTDNWQGWIWVWCVNQAGKEGWVPEDYFERNGKTGIALFDYSAVELAAEVEEILTVHREKGGWLWCTNQQGRNGWIPASNIEIQ